MDHKHYHREVSARRIPRLYQVASSHENNVPDPHFESVTNRQRALKNMGRLAAARELTYVGWDGCQHEVPTCELSPHDILYSEPIPSSFKVDPHGNYELFFKLVTFGNGADSSGTNAPGHRGGESIQVMCTRWNADLQASDTYLLDAKDHRWILFRHENSKRTIDGQNDFESLKAEIAESVRSMDISWDQPTAYAAAD